MVSTGLAKGPLGKGEVGRVSSRANYQAKKKKKCSWGCENESGGNENRRGYPGRRGRVMTANGPGLKGHAGAVAVRAETCPPSRRKKRV